MNYLENIKKRFPKLFKPTTSADQKLNLVFLICLLIVLCVGSIIEKLFNNGAKINLREVKYIDKDYQYIHTINENAFTSCDPYLLVHNNKLVDIFAPGRIVVLDDTITALLLISISVIFLVRTGKIIPDKPFTAQLISGIKWAGIMCFLFALINYGRLYLLNNYVKEITSNQYRISHFSFFSMGYAWIGIFLSWLSRILQKAEILQTEQELTV